MSALLYTSDLKISLGTELYPLQVMNGDRQMQVQLLIKPSKVDKPKGLLSKQKDRQKV